METQKISVIIPVYNVEKYLPKCIESVLSQSYTNLEIILVDDGSLDNSGLICDEYAKIDQRIIVYHKPNGGLSDARNYGINMCKGEYLTFIDSDDYIDPFFIETLFKLTVKFDSDISISNYIVVPESYGIDNIDNNIEHYSIKIFNKREALKALFSNRYKYQFTTAWGKLIKSKLITDIRFPKGRNYEDTATIHKFLYLSERVAYINRTQYYYVNRSTSITKKEQYIKDDIFLATLDRYNFFREKGFACIALKALKEHISTLMGVYIRLNDKLPCTPNQKDKIKKLLREALKSNKVIFIANPIITLKLIIFYSSPKIYRSIIGFSKKHHCQQIIDSGAKKS